MLMIIYRHHFSIPACQLKPDSEYCPKWCLPFLFPTILPELEKADFFSFLIDNNCHLPRCQGKVTTCNRVHEWAEIQISVFLIA